MGNISYHVSHLWPAKNETIKKMKNLHLCV